MTYKIRMSILMFIIALSCTQPRDEIRILSVGLDAHSQEELQIISDRKGWELDTGQLDGIQSEEISIYSSVMMTVSALDGLYYKDRNTLERYVEAGGGLIVVQDTVLAHPVWPLTRMVQQGVSRHFLEAGVIEVIMPEMVMQSEDIILETIGDNHFPEYAFAVTPEVPDQSRFTRQVLIEGMDEPMQMQVLPNHDVLIVERRGAVKLYDAGDHEVRVIARLDVFSGIEDGLLGVALDPDFETNHWAYFYYSPAGEESVNRLSRMKLEQGILDEESEQIILEIPTQRIYCCHSAGYLFFDEEGLLYLSVGDNTNAEEAEGYIPIDERPGRELADDQATAANTNDLRGKILRIKPEKDGTYSIPEGNLFPQGTPKTLPEIYVMGTRNPYRFSVDSKKGVLYWGDVGPDTKVEGEDGLMSYDEFNRADEPGFYGWPYFLGNNQPFPYYDFETKIAGPEFDPENPVNLSPNNTGLKELPPPQPAFIWYGKGSSEKFPLVGSGGASAAAGPVYYSSDFEGTPYQLPDYYDGKLFIYEWMRNWIMAVEFDEKGEMIFMEPFLDHFDFVAPNDMTFGPDGAIYILEYGTNWFSKNNDAKLVRIEYMEGNRPPVARIRADRTAGAHPLTVRLDGSRSEDFDDDAEDLIFQWNIEGKIIEGRKIEYTFTEPGVYNVVLEVKDPHGASGKSTIQVEAGNTPPEIAFDLKGNRSFYREKERVPYEISVYDAEDGDVPEEEVVSRFGYLANKEDLALVLGDTENLHMVKYKEARRLMSSSDCQSCHHREEESVGPSYLEIGEKYQRRSDAVSYLAEKIIEGGSGNWGSRPMTPHPDMEQEEAEQIVEYILAMSEEDKGIPSQGMLSFDQHEPGEESGAYVLITEYTDKGGAGDSPPIRMVGQNIWIDPKVEAEHFDEGNVGIATITTENLSYIRNVMDGSYIRFDQMDLSGIRELIYRIQGIGAGGKISVHLDSPDGPPISSLDVKGGSSQWQEYPAAVEGVDEVHDLYFVFKNPNAGDQPLFHVDWIYFSK